MCPRIRNHRVSTDVLSCHARINQQLLRMNIFCENPLVYSRYTWIEVVNNNRFCVVSPARVVGVYLGPCILAQSIFAREVVRGIFCLRCDQLIGFLRRANYYLVYGLVAENWRGHDNYLIDSDHDSDSGNDTETDVEYSDAEMEYNNPLPNDSGVDEDLV